MLLRWRWCRCRSRVVAGGRALAAIPPGGGKHGGGQGFFQRGIALVFAPAALEQRLARGVDVQRLTWSVVRWTKMRTSGGRCPHRAHAGFVAEAVGHRIFDLERGKVQALQRAVLGGDVDLKLWRGVNQISQATAAAAS